MHPLPACPRRRRLDHVADPAGLTAKLLEVLPVLPPSVRRDAIGFLPEVATEDAHPVGAAACWGRCLLGARTSLLLAGWCWVPRLHPRR